MSSAYQTLRRRWRDPDQIAIRFQDTAVRYGELEQRVRRALGWLRGRGLGRGDVLALQAPRSLALLELHLGALAGGIVTLPLNPAYTAREIAYYLRDARPRLAVLLQHPEGAPADTAVVLAEEVRAALDAAPPADPLADLPADAPAVIGYTSGTTGQPKGAVISHGNLLGTVAGLHAAWRWSPDDVLLHALPLFHIHGLFVAQHGALYAGAVALWMPRFTPEAALRHMVEDGVTVFMGVPTMYSRLLAMPPQPAEPTRLPGMRLLTSGSAPLPARAHAALEARFGHRVLERYGMTEVGIVLSNPYAPASARTPGAVGFPLPGVTVRVCDPEGRTLPDGAVGELRIRGPGVIREYLGRPEQTAEAIVDGWMRSGDLGLRGAGGRAHPPRGAGEGHDHLRRAERLPRGGGGRAAGGARRRRRRRSWGCPTRSGASASSPRSSARTTRRGRR